MRLSLFSSINAVPLGREDPKTTQKRVDRIKLVPIKITTSMTMQLDCHFGTCGWGGFSVEEIVIY